MTSPALTLDFKTLLDNIVVPGSGSLSVSQAAYELSQAQRIFHGRGHAYDKLDHITIDWFEPLLLITLFAPVNQEDIQALVKQLVQKFQHCKSIQIQYRYNKDWELECLYGDPIKHLVILENNLKYQLTFKSGANTGLFLDMRNGREWVANNSGKKRVLNLFSYTCGFSIAAASAKASAIYNIDMSSPFLTTGRNNHRLNNHSLASITFEKLNILKSFGRIKKQAPYDLIICDPPTFQKGSFDISRDYPKLVRRLYDFLSDEGLMMLCINTPHIGSHTGRDFLLKTVSESSKNLKLVDEITPPAVYKETQGKGVKTLIYKKRYENYLKPTQLIRCYLSLTFL